MGKKGRKQPQGKGEEMKIDFGGGSGAGNAKYEPKPQNTQNEQKKLVQQNSGGGFYGGGGGSGGMMQQFSKLQPEEDKKDDYAPVDFMAESSMRQVKNVNQPQS